MPGYPVLELDKMIFQELICEYCDTVVRDALRANCGHFYCRSCVDYLFRGNTGAVAYCKKSRTPLFYFQSHVGSCSLASIQRGEQKECESDETLSNKTDDKRESLLSDSVVENHPPTRETAACPEFGVGADFSEHVTRDGVRKSETRRSRREQSSAKVVKNYSLTRGTGDCHEGGISVCRADRPGDFKEERARRIETRRSCNERGSADVMEKGQINANLPRQVNFLLSGNMAGQNKNSTKNSLELKEEMNPSLNDTITRNTASPRISAPNVSDQHEQRLIDLENQVAYLTHCFSNRYQVTNDIAIVIQHLVSENDQLKNTVRDINNRVNQIQVHLNSHQANFNTLRNERSDQREELVRIQERIRRLEEHANAQETMLRNVSDSIRGLATLTRSRDIENL